MLCPVSLGVQRLSKDLDGIMTVTCSESGSNDTTLLWAQLKEFLHQRRKEGKCTYERPCILLLDCPQSCQRNVGVFVCMFIYILNTEE